MFNFNDDWKLKTCKECKYFIDFGHKRVDLKEPLLHECRKNPPQTLALLANVPGKGMITQLTVVYPRLPEMFPACANYFEKPSDEK